MKNVRFTKKKINMSELILSNNFLSFVSRYININTGKDKIGNDHNRAAAVVFILRAILLMTTTIDPAITK
jgi:hypothetical protein